MRVVIIGAGIGGLAAGIALRRIGAEVVVVERAADIREVGAGLSIWSNGVGALRELGVDAGVLASASVIERNESRTPSGVVIAANQFSEISQSVGAPNICVHRAVLQRILLDALPRAAVRTGACCTGFQDATAILETGERIEADVLVGADGLSSVIRAGLHGSEPPRYAGYTCWRAVRPATDVLPAGSALLAAGGGAQFGLWPCGEGQVYWFLTKNAPQGTRLAKADAKELCRHWAAPIPEIIEGTAEDAILQNDIVDRPPLRWWGRGCVTLLGDAAHACTPNLGQGACQALEDAVVLAQCLRDVRPVESALREYERVRVPRTAAVVRNSWRTGRLLQLDRPALEALRNWFMGSAGGRRLGMRMVRGLLTHQLPKL